jgi:hypothetical protein
MTDDQIDPGAPDPPPASEPESFVGGSLPPESHSSGWVVAGVVVGALALGGLVAAVVARGDDGATNNPDPAANIQVLQTTSNSATTVVQPAATVTVDKQVTVKTPTTTVQQPAVTRTTPSDSGASRTVTAPAAADTTPTTTSP